MSRSLEGEITTVNIRLRGRAPRGLSGELSPASVYVSLLPVVEACVVVAVRGRVGEVRVPTALKCGSIGAGHHAH